MNELSKIILLGTILMSAGTLASEGDEAATAPEAAEKSEAEEDKVVDDEADKADDRDAKASSEESSDDSSKEPGEESSKEDSKEADDGAAEEGPSSLAMTLVTQTGGYVGRGAIGLGLEYGGVLRTEVMGGLTPSNIEGVDDIRQVALKSSVGYRFGLLGLDVGPYFGFSVIYHHGDDDTFVKSPSKYPSKKYYPPTAVRAAPVLGMEAAAFGIGVFAEATALDTYLETYVRGKGGMKWTEFSTYALGVRFWAW